MSDTVITRFPPSPTGRFHIGSARTALFNFVFARKHGGKFILRFEDTDKERSEKQYETDILDGLKWLNLKTDGEITRQSERTEIYKKYLEKLLELGNAYEAEESESGSEKVIRFKNPNREVIFNDLVRGEVKFDTTELGDFVIAKNKSKPLYHLTVVVDDELMGVTHAIRGEDHVSNTPRQILIIEALGFKPPEYAHIPLILAPDRSKLSKRKDSVSITDYQDKGYLPEAIVNYIMLLGWSPSSDKELFSMDEIIKEFSIKDVNKGGSVFDVEKLKWFNKEYLNKLSDDEFIENIKPYVSNENRLIEMIDLYRERIHIFSEAKDLEQELSFLFAKPSVDKIKLNWKETKNSETITHLRTVSEKLEELDDFHAESIKRALWDYAEEKGKGNVLWPLRFSLTGAERSPDPFTVAALLGKKETIERLEDAIKNLEI